VNVGAQGCSAEDSRLYTAGHRPGAIRGRFSILDGKIVLTPQPAPNLKKNFSQLPISRPADRANIKKVLPANGPRAKAKKSCRFWL